VGPHEGHRIGAAGGWAAAVSARASLRRSHARTVTQTGGASKEKGLFFFCCCGFFFSPFLFLFFYATSWLRVLVWWGGILRSGARSYTNGGRAASCGCAAYTTRVVVGHGDMWGHEWRGVQMSVTCGTVGCAAALDWWTAAMGPAGWL
jgi:hypothetical protein